MFGVCYCNCYPLSWNDGVGVCLFVDFIQDQYTIFVLFGCSSQLGTCRLFSFIYPVLGVFTEFTPAKHCSLAMVLLMGTLKHCPRKGFSNGNALQLRSWSPLGPQSLCPYKAVANWPIANTQPFGSNNQIQNCWLRIGQTELKFRQSDQISVGCNIKYMTANKAVSQMV